MNSFLRVVVVVLALVGIFLAGSITGGVLTAQFLDSRHRALDREREAQFQRFSEAKAQVLRQQMGQADRAVRQQLEDARQQLRQLQQFIAQEARGGQQRMAGPWRRTSPEQFAPVLMQRIFNQVQPTPEEREKIRPLIFQASEDLRRLRRDTAHQSEIVVEHLEDQIAAVLTPAQLDRFNELIQQWRQRLENFNRQEQEFEAEQRLIERQQQRHPPPPNKLAPPPAAEPPAPSSPKAATSAPAS